MISSSRQQLFCSAMTLYWQTYVETAEAFLKYPDISRRTIFLPLAVTGAPATGFGLRLDQWIAWLGLAAVGCTWFDKQRVSLSPAILV